MQEKTKVANLYDKTFQAKHKVLDMAVYAGMGHLSSAFSCAEILTVLYYDTMHIDPQNPDWEGRDRLVISKNHASIMQYPILADLGFYDETKLRTFLNPVMGQKWNLGSHSKLSVPGVDFAGGSLGMGLGVAAGIAYAAKLDSNSYLTFCLLGDGECYEGSVWEAAMFAAHNQLNNLIVIIDRNRLAITDFTEKMLGLEPFENKWDSFGWDTRSCNGHDIGVLLDCLCDIRNRLSNKPLCIIADTVKGKGISFIENKLNWHGAVPRNGDIEKAYTELEGKRSCYELNP